MYKRLFVLLAIFKNINGVTFKCDFRSQTWYNELHYSYDGMSSNFYECRNTNGEIKSYDTAVTSIDGNHLNRKGNSDVVSFDTQNHPIHYFPTELNEFFENLKSIRIKKSQLKRLREEDLEPFWDLRLLCLSNNNIERLEGNVFKHNKKLEYLSLDVNTIHVVDVGTFDHLAVLKSLLFRGNPCHSDLAFYNPKGVIKLAGVIGDKCKDLTKSIDVRTIYHL
ncbi:leucine-rich repeat-containing protein egg-6-like [Chironomus tepperi]|uniref:leucine-rich repeat-containing protein egg-6-like n=1 Tax=Chironomus tepperi TaxID=113505 RepID=UPI00391F71CF